MLLGFLAETIEILSATPERAAHLTRGLSEEQLSRKPNPEFFSLRENVLHLRDIDVEGYEKRIGRILNESSPVLEDVNGGQLARERDYNAQPLEPALVELALSRAASLGRLQKCQESDLERTAEMQGSGIVTLRRLLEMWMRHDAEHLLDMEELRRAVEAGDPNVSFEEHEAA
jgi:DinB family protein